MKYARNIIEDISKLMLTKHNYSPKTIYHYRKIWDKFLNYTESNNYSAPTTATAKEYLKTKFNGRKIDSLSRWEVYHIRVVRVLVEYYELNEVNFIPHYKKKKFEFLGEIGKCFIQYINYKRDYHLLKVKTIKDYKRNLFWFYDFLNTENIHDISSITSSSILTFIKSIQTKNVSIKATLDVLRGFLKYLYLSKIIKDSLHVIVPKYKNVQQPKIPSVYSKDEVKQLISSVDRNTKSGKRMYAFILLALMLGLRASDIATLTFNDIDFKKSIITKIQYKTGKIVILPLISNVGNAIIDYINAMPNLNTKYIFSSLRPPYGPITGSVVSSAITRQFASSGIEIQKRKKGSHSLRHTFVANLLDSEVSYHIISESIGHSNLYSTMNYIRIDTKKLTRCTLTLPEQG